MKVEEVRKVRMEPEGRATTDIVPNLTVVSGEILEKSGSKDGTSEVVIKAGLEARKRALFMDEVVLKRTGIPVHNLNFQRNSLDSYHHTYRVDVPAS